MKKTFFNGTIPLALTVSILSGCTQPETVKNTPPSVTGQFEITVLKSGEADAMVLNTDNHCIIIDCGEKDDGDEVLQCLSDKGTDSVDYMFITHFDKDHVGGAAEVIENTEIKKIITPDYAAASDEYESYVKAAEEKGIVPVKLTKNMTFILDDVMFEVYPPMKKSYAEGDNDFSLAIGVIHGENSFLFTGDAEEVRLKEITSQTDREYDFLKVPHHGNYNKLTQMFIDSVNPKYAVITCSNKNPADDKTVSLLESIGCEVYTSANTDVSIKSDGSKITVSEN